MGIFQGVRSIIFQDSMWLTDDANRHFFKIFYYFWSIRFRNSRKSWRNVYVSILEVVLLSHKQVIRILPLWKGAYHIERVIFLSYVYCNKCTVIVEAFIPGTHWYALQAFQRKLVFSLCESVSFLKTGNTLLHNKKSLYRNIYVILKQTLQNY